MTSAEWVNCVALGISLVFVLSLGRAPERWGIIAAAAGFLITPLVERRDSWTEPQMGILAVDIAFLVAMILIAFRYHRLWPLWTAGLQAVTVLCHLAFLVNPAALYRAFYVANFSIGYLVLGSIVGGVIMESRAPPRLRFPAHRGAP